MRRGFNFVGENILIGGIGLPKSFWTNVCLFFIG
jgi:hypothetical protein